MIPSGGMARPTVAQQPCTTVRCHRCLRKPCGTIRCHRLTTIGRLSKHAVLCLHDQGYLLGCPLHRLRANQVSTTSQLCLATVTGSVYVYLTNMCDLLFTNEPLHAKLAKYKRTCTCTHSTTNHRGHGVPSSRFVVHAADDQDRGMASLRGRSAGESHGRHL